MDGNPNYYTRADVLRLARVIDPDAWKDIPPGMEPHQASWDRESMSRLWKLTDPSIRCAARILIAGYRDCTL